LLLKAEPAVRGRGSKEDLKCCKHSAATSAPMQASQALGSAEAISRTLGSRIRATAARLHPTSPSVKLLAVGVGHSELLGSVPVSPFSRHCPAALLPQPAGRLEEDARPRPLLQDAVAPATGELPAVLSRPPDDGGRLLAALAAGLTTPPLPPPPAALLGWVKDPPLLEGARLARAGKVASAAAVPAALLLVVVVEEREEMREAAKLLALRLLLGARFSRASLDSLLRAPAAPEGGRLPALLLLLLADPGLVLLLAGRSSA
jgi:hypothetical protein